MMKRLDDFVAVGAENLWVIDPADRSGSTYSRFGLKLVDGTRLSIPESPIYLELPEIFTTMDEARGKRCLNIIAGRVSGGSKKVA